MAAEFLSQDWVDAFWTELRAEPTVRDLAKRWIHGPIGLVVDATPEHGLDEPVMIRLMIHAGEVRDVARVGLDDAPLVPTIIAAPFARWKTIIGSRGDLIAAALASQVRFTGDLPAATTNRALFSALTSCASKVETDWQDEAAERETAGASA